MEPAALVSAVWGTLTEGRTGAALASVVVARARVGVIGSWTRASGGSVWEAEEREEGDLTIRLGSACELRLVVRVWAIVPFCKEEKIF